MRSATLTLAAITVMAVVTAWPIPSLAADEPKPAEATPAPSIKPTLLMTLSTPGRIGSLAFDSKGEKLATVGWDTVDGKPGAMADWTQGKSRGDIRIWNLAGGTQIAQFGSDCGGLFGAAFAPDNKTLITGGRAVNAPRKGEVRIWDAQTQQPIRSLGGPTDWVICVAVSPDGKLIAAGGFDRTIRIWEAATGKEVTVIRQPKLAARSVAFSNDGKTLVVGYGTGLVWLFQVGRWDELNFFEGGKNFFLLSAALSPDGKRLIGAGAEQKPARGRNQQGLIYVWDVATTAVVRADQVDQLVSDVVFSPDGKYYAACGFVSRIWTTDKGEVVADLQRGNATSGDKMCFSLDGKRLAIGAVNNVTVWDVSDLVPAKRGK